MAPSKNAFQNCSFKKISQYCSLKKMHNKKHSKIAPSKNVFQNYYKLSIENKNQYPVGLKTLDM